MMNWSTYYVNTNMRIGNIIGIITLRGAVHMAYSDLFYIHGMRAISIIIPLAQKGLIAL